jgi:hypothetical protein
VALVFFQNNATACLAMKNKCGAAGFLTAGREKCKKNTFFFAKIG